MANPLSALIDVQQKRVKQKAVFTLADASSWDKTLGDGGCCLDPLYGMVMLRPRFRESSWRTSTTSPYDKLAVADFTGITGAKWATHDHTGTGGGKMLVTIDSSANSETGKTSATIGQNRGVVLTLMSYGDGSDREVLRFGFSGTTAYTSGIGFRLYSGGRLAVYKDGTLIDEVNVVGSGNGGNIDNRFCEIMVLPCRKRELLIWCSLGGMASVAFGDVDMTPTEPEIVPDTYFWFQFQGGTPCIQVAPLKFNTTGTFYSQKSAFKRAPSASAVAWDFTSTNPIFTTVTNALFYGHRAKAGEGAITATLRNGTDSGAFTPNGSNTDCRIKVTLTGGGSYTPFLYGALMGYKPETASTSATNISLDDYLRRCSITVPDNPQDVEVRLELKKPYAIEQAGAVKLRTIANRPVSIKFGSYAFMDGWSSDHHWEDGEQDEVRHFYISVRDRMKSAELMLLDDPIPLDGLTLTAALKFLGQYLGLNTSATSTEIDIESTTFHIPDTPGETWNVMLEAGDTVAESFRRLVEDYAATWFWGFKPYDIGAGGAGIKLFAKSPTGIGTTPKMELWPTLDEAKTYLQGLGYSSDDADRLKRLYVYTSFSETVLEPECNELYVTGYDVTTDRPIVVYRRDTSAIDPTKVPSARPNNWQGEVVTCGISNSGYTSLATCIAAADILDDRLMTFRRLPTWAAQMLWYTGTSGAKLPVWRGDVVRLRNVAAVTGYVDYRIKSFDGESTFEPDNALIQDGQVRPYQYSAEEIR